jgi:hypothetical protein
MRAAPPVSVRGTGGWPWRAAQTGLQALAAGVALAWGLQRAELPVAPALLAACVVALVAWRLNAAPAVTLVWDGRRWQADGTPGSLEVMLDFGSWLLLRLRPEGRRGGRWIALDAAEVGASLHALRAALYARAARIEGIDGGSGPAARVPD